MEIQQLSKTCLVRRLCKQDVPQVLKLCMGNPQFYRYHPPLATEDSIREDMQALPPGKGPSDKFYVGYFADSPQASSKSGSAGQLAAVMDLILDYPEERTAYIGFFMVDAALQGTGVGSGLVREASEYLRSLGYIKLRLGVDRGNPQSLAFWRKNGFLQVSEGTYIVMERATLQQVHG